MIHIFQSSFPTYKSGDKLNSTVGSDHLLLFVPIFNIFFKKIENQKIPLFIQSLKLSAAEGTEDLYDEPAAAADPNLPACNKFL